MDIMRTIRKNKRWVLLLLLAAVLSVSLTACGTAQQNENAVTRQNPLVVLVTNTGAMGDGGFFDAGWSGCEAAKKDHEIDIRCLESGSGRQLSQNLQTAGNDGAMLVVIMGGGHENVIHTAADKYPRTNFFVVDGKAYGKNTAGVTFAEQEAAYLTGIAAAMNTRKKTVGFVGGRKTTAIRNYEIGFTAGVQTVDPDIRVRSRYIDSMTNSSRAAAAARALHQSGIDVIMQAAGAAGRGVMREAGKEEYYVVGTDADQSVQDSRHVLCSAVRHLNAVIEEEIQNALKGRFQPVNRVADLQNDGVGYSDNAGNLSHLVKERLRRAEKQIRRGRITVPYNAATLRQFQAPDLEP